MKKSFIIYLSALILGACVNTELSKNTNFDPTKEARIRLYGQNGRATLMEFFHNGKVHRVNVGGDLDTAFASLMWLKRNESIGMTESEFSRNPSALSGVISKAYFKEFIIPAGVEVQVNNHIDELVFIPKAGKDYEVTPNPKAYGIHLRELN